MGQGHHHCKCTSASLRRRQLTRRLLQPGGQDNQLVVKDLATRSDATYLLQTNDDPPAYITAKSKGWRTGPKDVLERLAEPQVADTVPANQYKFRVCVELETGDERYAFLNTCLWLGSGCRRTNESKCTITLNAVFLFGILLN